MKEVLLFLLCYLWIHSCFSYGGLLDNSGFEEPVSENASDDQANWYTWVITSTHESNWKAHSGSQSLLIEGTWNDTPLHGGIEQKAEITAGNEYGLNFYYYWDSGFTSLQHDVVIDWRDASDDLLSSMRYEMKTGDPDVGWKHPGWHKFTKFPLEAPSNAALIEIRFEFEGIGSLGAFYIDDVDLTDTLTTRYDEQFAVSGGNDYTFDFDYRWLNAFDATASGLEICWLDNAEDTLESHFFPVNQVGNADLWHPSGTYFLTAPTNAQNVRVRLLSLNLNTAANLQITNAVWTTGSADHYELQNNSFETTAQTGADSFPLNGRELGNWAISGACSQTTNTSCHGTTSLLFSEGTGTAAQVIQVDAGTEYECVLHHMLESGTSSRTNRLELVWMGDTVGTTLLASNIIDIALPTQGAGWQQLVITGLTVHADANAVRIKLSSTAAEGSVPCYLDDVFFREPVTFFRRDTTNILDLAENPFMIRGVALSGWFFPEAYMFGIEGGNGGHINTYTQVRNRFEEIMGVEDSDAFWDTYTTNFLTEADVAALAERGVNTVRLPFNFREISPENNEGAYRMKGFEQMDRAIDWCRTHGIYVILDMHSCPGGQAYVNSGDSEYVFYNTDWSQEITWACLWRFDDDYNDLTGRTPESNVARTADIWRFIAQRYRNEPQVLGYELINEPYLFGSEDTDPENPHLNSTNFNGQVIREAFLKISDAVRQVDDRHMFFIEGDLFAEWCDNLMPRWDDNMGVAFHRYWKTNAVDCLDEYLELRDTYQVPLWLSESGENSNPWCRELWDLLEEHQIGYTWWAWKKVGATYAGFSAEQPTGLQYCVDNLWNSGVDATQFEDGLLDMANALKTINCVERKGYWAALLSDWFSTETRPFALHTIPGIINSVDYDLGNQDNAYYDTEYKSDSYYAPVAYNQGNAYRNDGVDIFEMEGEGCGFVVGNSESVANEWTQYTLYLLHPGIYTVSLRVAAKQSGGQLRLYLDGSPATDALDIPNTGASNTFQTVQASSEITLTAGSHTLECRTITGAFNLSTIEFALSETGFVDYDADEMDDHWEIERGGDLTPDDDPDGDAMSNLREYFADTDPTNSASLFATELMNDNGEMVVILPQSSAQRVYSVEYKTDLTDPAWEGLTTKITGSGEAMALIQTNTANGYFRIQAAMP